MNKLIVLTNDDGIKSPGIKAAAEALASLGELIIVAPTVQMTSAGRSFKCKPGESLKKKSLKIDGKNISGWHMDASPAMLVDYSLKTIFSGRKPDLLVSGINFGENLGSNLTISGTVGAAIEGAAAGIPSIAVSLQTPIEYHFKYGKVDFTDAKNILTKVSEYVLNKGMFRNVDLLNINVPQNVDKNIPFRFTKISRYPYFYTVLNKTNGKNTISDLKLEINLISEKNSDINAVKEGVISISPMTLEMSAKADFKNLSFE